MTVGELKEALKDFSDDAELRAVSMDVFNYSFLEVDRSVKDKDYVLIKLD